MQFYWSAQELEPDQGGPSSYQWVFNGGIQVIVLQGKSTEWVLNSALVAFVLCSYFRWKQALRRAQWIDAGPLAESERGLASVRGAARPAFAQLSIPLKQRNHIDCLRARLQILIWLGGTGRCSVLTVETDFTSNQRRMPGSLYAVEYVVLSIHMFCRRKINK